MATTDAHFVVCGIHELRFSAAGRCPECSETGAQGTAPTGPVRIVWVAR